MFCSEDSLIQLGVITRIYVLFIARVSYLCALSVILTRYGRGNVI